MMATFARQVKNELARISLQALCCANAEIKGFLQMSGRLVLSRERMEISLETENNSVARRLFSLFKFCFDLPPAIVYSRRKQLHKNNVYLLQLPASSGLLDTLQDFGLVTGHFPDREESPSSLLQRKCCRRAYLRGAFLARGSLNNQERGYHLEITTPYESYARSIQSVLQTFSLEARFFPRKDDYIIYLKGAEKIGEFLRIIQAHRALLEFENTRVLKGIRNRTNRLVNCETANLTRTVMASARQIESINTIKELAGLDKLPLPLRQAAFLRLRFPEANLQELGSKAIPPLTRSCINHRLRKLNSLANKLKEEQ